MMIDFSGKLLSQSAGVLELMTLQNDVEVTTTGSSSAFD